MKKIILVLIFGLIMTSGCTSVGTYAKNRANDCLDMVKLSVGVKLGAHADVQATDLCHMGVGMGVGVTTGLYGRELGGGFEVDDNFPVTQIRYLLTSKKNLPAYSKILHPFLKIHGHAERAVPGHNSPNVNGDVCCISPLIAGGWITPKNKWAKSKTFHRLFDIEAGVTAGIVGGRVGFSPGECLDFILGIFTLDFAKDDTKKSKKK